MITIELLLCSEFPFSTHSSTGYYDFYLSPTKHLHNIPHTTSHRHDWHRYIRRKQLKYAYKLITATPEVEIYKVKIVREKIRKHTVDPGKSKIHEKKEIMSNIDQEKQKENTILAKKKRMKTRS